MLVVLVALSTVCVPKKTTLDVRRWPASFVRFWKFERTSNRYKRWNVIPGHPLPKAILESLNQPFLFESVHATSIDSGVGTWLYNAHVFCSLCAPQVEIKRHTVTNLWQIWDILADGLGYQSTGQTPGAKNLQSQRPLNLGWKWSHGADNRNQSKIKSDSKKERGLSKVWLVVFAVCCRFGSPFASCSLSSGLYFIKLHYQINCHTNLSFMPCQHINLR